MPHTIMRHFLSSDITREPYTVNELLAGDQEVIFVVQDRGEEKIQIIREQLLREMLHDFNEGRSKSFYCNAATILAIDEL